MKQNTTRRLILCLVLLLTVLLAAGCGKESPDSTVSATASATASPGSTGALPAPEATSEPTDDGGETSSDDVAAAVTSHTPVPSPTPGIIDQEINDLTTSLGLSGETFLGLTADDWINLAFSALVVALGYFLGFKLLVWFLKWIAQRTSRKFNKTILKELEPNLKLLLLVFFTRFAVLRLDFLSEGLRTALDDIFLSWDWCSSRSFLYS